MFTKTRGQQADPNAIPKSSQMENTQKSIPYRNGWGVTTVRCHASVGMDKVTTACSAAEPHVCYRVSSFRCVDGQVQRSSLVLQGSGGISLGDGGKDSEAASICESCSAS